MKRKHSPFTIVVLSLSLLLFVVPAGAQTTIKERFKQRLPIIEKMKAQGIVGEDHLGFLQFIGDKQENAALVAAENKDRRQVYQAIAQREGSSIELVGRLRAKQIAAKADPGEWLQHKSGEWYRK